MTIKGNEFNLSRYPLFQIIDPYKNIGKRNSSDPKIKLVKESLITKFWRKIEAFKVRSIKRRAMKIKWLNGIEQKHVADLFTGVDTKKELSKSITLYLKTLPESIKRRTNFSEVNCMFKKGHYKEGLRVLHRATFIGFALEKLNKSKKKELIFTINELNRINEFSGERINLYEAESFNEIEHLINKMDAYKAILSIEEINTLKNLKFELKNNYTANFHKALTEHLSEKMALCKTKYQTDKNNNGLSLKYFYYKELYSAFRKEKSFWSLGGNSENKQTLQENKCST